MTKNSNATNLSSLLREKQEQDRQLIEQQTIEQLRLHAESLQQLSSAALNTTQRVIDAQSKFMIERLNESKKQIDQQSQRLAAEIQEQTRRLLWLMKWPILGTLIVCLLVCLLTWSWWRLTAPYNFQAMGNGGQYQVMKGSNWTTCQISRNPQILAPCRPVSGNN